MRSRRHEPRRHGDVLSVVARRVEREVRLWRESVSSYPEGMLRVLPNVHLVTSHLLENVCRGWLFLLFVHV